MYLLFTNNKESVILGDVQKIYNDNEESKMKVINSDLLFQYLEKANLNYSELAEKTAISRNTFYNILCGKNFPSYSVMSILASSLEFTQSEFIEVFFPNVEFKDEVT